MIISAIKKLKIVIGFRKLFQKKNAGNVSSYPTADLGKGTIIINTKITGHLSTGINCSVENVEVTGEVLLGKSVNITRGAILHGNIEIGDYTVLSGPSIDLFTLGGKVIIGKYCSIARHVTIQEGNHKYKSISYNYPHRFFADTIPTLESAYFSNGDIVIGNDVWIAAHTVIINNVKIGDGAIIGANSLVNKNVEPYSIMGGVPAKIIGYRFDKEIIDLLLKIKWWDLDHTVLNKHIHLFTEEISFSQINDFYEELLRENKI